MIALLRDALEKGKSLRFKANAKGHSMSPFLKHGDVLTISALKGGKLHVGDVAAFVMPGLDKRMIVHRVIGVQGTSPVFKGDNVSAADGPIPPSDVLGRVTRVERNGKPAIGVGPERFLIAILSRAGILIPLISRVRSLSRRMTGKLPTHD